MISETERLRYARNIAIEQIGREGQDKLLGFKVLIIGCGALGSVAAMYLAAAGVGLIGLVEFDTIDISNLQRQIFYNECDTGNSKAETLKKRISDINSHTIVDLHICMLTKRNATELLSNYDFIVDATDNPDSKLLIDNVCSQLSKPCTIGGVNGFRGQVMTCLPHTARYSSLFPDAAGENGFTPCSIAGVIGPAAGTVASIQASEVIKYATGAGSLLTDRLLAFDLLNDSFHCLRL